MPPVVECFARRVAGIKSVAMRPLPFAPMVPLTRAGLSLAVRDLGDLNQQAAPPPA